MRAHEIDERRREAGTEGWKEEVRKDYRTGRKEELTEGANKGRRGGRNKEKVGQTGRQTRCSWIRQTEAL